MATLVADGAPPQPPHPTMPPYAPRETSQHPNELHFQVERHSKPKIRDTTPLGTKSYAEMKCHLTMTMEIHMMLANHDPTLPILFSLPTASAATHWQHKHINIANGLDSTDTSPQRNTQHASRTPHDNIQLPDMMLPTQLPTPSHTGYKDDSQCSIPGGRPMPLNHTLQKDNPTPKIAHAEPPTHFYKKNNRKSHSTITLSPVQSPQHDRHPPNTYGNHCQHNSQ